MYRGLARLVGMTVVEPGKTLADQMEVAKANWDKYDFFFIHYKYTDSTGEDGNFAKKVEMIEALDAEIPKLRALKPDVLIVTGDHSTPSRMKSHSFHPVPTLLWAPATGRPDLVTDLRRAPLPPGRPRPVPRQGPHAAGPGPRRPAPEVRGLIRPAAEAGRQDAANSATRPANRSLCSIRPMCGPGRAGRAAPRGCPGASARSPRACRSVSRSPATTRVGTGIVGEGRRSRRSGACRASPGPGRRARRAA